MTNDRMMALSALTLAMASCAAMPTRDGKAVSLPAQADAVMARATAIYADLHEHPELSHQELRTSGLLAKTLRELGFDVHEGMGGHGVVGLLRNGSGKLVMLRTDMDALPLEETTADPHRSRVRALDQDAREVPVMHACGHDLHMAAWIGTAELLSTHRDAWNGTLMFVAQPAEETLSGARALLKDGLFSRFGKPEVAFAIHVHDQLPVGTVGYVYGPFAASADSVDIVVHGRGGHGAFPHTAIDPIVIASRIVISLQTIVSRENDPMNPVVVTVGSIHGGTRHNIIPDEVKLQLTVRTYRPEVRTRVLSSIQRIANAEAAAAGALEMPSLSIHEGTSAAVSDPSRTRLVVDALRTLEPGLMLKEIAPDMGAEDFGEYGSAGVPSVMLQVGVVDRETYAAAQKHGRTLTPIHAASFLPKLPESLRTAILVESTAMLTYLRARTP